MIIQRNGRTTPGFALGTVGGFWSVEDIKQLVANKDVELAAMGAQVDKSTDASVKQDWAKLSAAYQAARAAALKAAADHDTALLPDSLVGNVFTDKAYKDVIAALQPVAGQVTPGSKQDIGSRLMAAGWKPDYKIPYQYAPDADLDFYRTTQPPNVAGGWADFLAWLRAHRTALTVGGAALGGVVVLGVLSPYARLAAAALPRRRAG